MMALTGCRVVTARTVLDPGWLTMDRGLITAVGRGDPPGGIRTTELSGGWLLPGFIDLHMHGGGGAQITTDDPDEIRRAVAFHREHGTTRTLASLVTDRLDRMIAAVSVLAAMIDAGEPGIAGIHLEGPFLNPSKRGSHHSDYLLPPDPDALRRLLHAGRGHVRVVTLAPELPGGMSLLTEVVR